MILVQGYDVKNIQKWLDYENESGVMDLDLLLVIDSNADIVFENETPTDTEAISLIKQADKDNRFFALLNGAIAGVDYIVGKETEITDEMDYDAIVSAFSANVREFVAKNIVDETGVYDAVCESLVVAMAQSMDFPFSFATCYDAPFWTLFDARTLSDDVDLEKPAENMVYGLVDVFGAADNTDATDGYESSEKSE